ncbi:MAG TPA: zinc ABC transporter substrate-binding protein [Candidatus Aphodocola excrementigallinarum]|uniref:Zinc ABC transporter substrate-binding protein n=1 Tax=Candidatus Aphodocola excrementigallinarum TaxID=2840670 RepID=A0A9D1LHV4_9FIRM|nr:zinc ABC transporter substrate-binding protein [Candidatus Aphodocola excrementigallinarum]
MKNKLLLIIAAIFIMVTLSGCSNNKDENKEMTAYTSVYPVEYILDNLYGDEIEIYSIYPDGTNYKNYELTNKQIQDYSNAELFVYNGTIQKEKDYAVELLNENKNLKIIDASQGMNYTNDVSENWLNPSNYLMMASNIKNGLEEYINERIEIDKINENYENLKFELTELDAELSEAASSSDNPTIIVSDDTFKYLEKYGFTVISLEENNNLTEKVLTEARRLISNGTCDYIFLKDDEEENETIKKLKNSYSNIQTVSLNTISTLSATQRKDKIDYMSIMQDNINSIKLEVND